jgi:hypothetical protein
MEAWSPERYLGSCTILSAWIENFIWRKCWRPQTCRDLAGSCPARAVFQTSSIGNVRVLHLASRSCNTASTRTNYCTAKSVVPSITLVGDWHHRIAWSQRTSGRTLRPLQLPLHVGHKHKKRRIVVH